MITGILLVAILIDGNPSFKAQRICAVNQRDLSAECVNAHRAELKLSPGRYEVTVDGEKAATADISPSKATTVYLSK
ncbi:hypothetical protein [Thiothrix sp.]|jgi:hypothetical protein|uniref:hypothetical protein n=1 Tax=Thiothrix sp. TaxID=1032 RepID=UPI0025811954|nr:hypothetical protein [Thiothrix sp.]